MIAECLKAAGVERVVWIDDNFAQRNRVQNFDALISAFKVARAKQPAATLEIPHLGHYVLGDPLDDALDSLEEAQRTCGDPEIATATLAVELFAGVVPADVALDLSQDEIDALLGAFGDKITKQSLTEWRKEGADKFAMADRRTLFLIDKEFYREDPGYDGLLLLQNLAAGDAFCMMFTCRCEEGGQEECRKTYSEKAGIPAHRFSVISKLGRNAVRPIVERFAYALRAAFLHRQTGDLAQNLAIELRKTVDQVARDLIAQNVTDLDQAIFENSISEGASELDVLLRINVLRQRRDARLAFQGEKLKNILVEMRRFRRATESHFPNPEPAAMEQFRAWRQIEVFEEGDLINPIHAPLGCGDIFSCVSTSDGKVQTGEFLLLAQPCDLMVRGTGALEGTRAAEAGLMVSLTKVVPGKKGADSARFYDIVGVLPGKRVWRLDFRDSFVVDLAVLDFCVFDPKGKVALSTATMVVEGLMSVGYEIALRKAKEWLAALLAPDSKVAPKSISVGARGSGYQYTLDRAAARLEFPLTRVGRLEPTVAHASLAAWATYQTRAALDHDFAKTAKTTAPAAAPAAEPAAPPAAPPVAPPAAAPVAASTLGLGGRFRNWMRALVGTHS
jgi:hypothetical protein